jgi:hypothetical protein
MAFAQTLRQTYPKAEVQVPEYRQTLDFTL